MNANPGLAMQRPAQSDTIPILNAGSVSRTRSVMRVKRGGCQTPKASINRLTAGGSPSFGTRPAHHRVPAPPPAAATTRLPSSHGITGICEVVWGKGMKKGNAACAAGKLECVNAVTRTVRSKYNILILANRVFGFFGYKYVGA
jgi:hypothetical protein